MATDWITLSQTGGTGSTSITVSASTNTGYSRSLTVKFSGVDSQGNELVKRIVVGQTEIPEDRCIRYSGTSSIDLSWWSDYTDYTIVGNYYDNGVGLIVFDRSVEVIPEGGFEQLTNLTAIKLPSTINTVGVRAFNECSNIKSITGLENSSGLTFEVDENNDESNAFALCPKLTYLSLPSNIISSGGTSLKKLMFYNSFNLTTIVYSGYTYEWTALTKDPEWRDNSYVMYIKCLDGYIDADEPVFIIYGGNAFGTQIDPVSYVKGDRVLRLKESSLPSGITITKKYRRPGSIGSCAYYFSGPVESVELELKDVNTWDFTSDYKCCPIEPEGYVYIPMCMKQNGFRLYDTDWGAYLKLKPGFREDTVIPNQAFYSSSMILENESARTVVVKKSVQQIGSGAYAGITASPRRLPDLLGDGLNLIIESGIAANFKTDVGPGAFARSIYVNVSLGTINCLPERMFEGCYRLVEITIPITVTEIRDYALNATYGHEVNNTVINYEGTMAQWNNIIKGSYWSLYRSGVIHCTDGDITL